MQTIKYKIILLQSPRLSILMEMSDNKEFSVIIQSVRFM